jgi:hypothetical protein
MKSAIAALLIMLGMIVAMVVEAKRDLGCRTRADREREICRGVARNMQWEWTGHAIVAPGWRITFDTLRRVYCDDKITVDDIAALKHLAEDRRVENGAVGLLTLLRTSPEAKAARIPDSEFNANTTASYCIDTNCVFNPENPQYILRGGCNSTSTPPR